MNDWLDQEFKERVSVERKLELTPSLAKVLKTLSVRITPAEEKEEQNIIAQKSDWQWSNTSAACANTWFCLSDQVMGQLSVGFSDAETVKMSELAFWKKRGGNNRKTEAEAMADILSKMFRGMLGATYKPGRDYPSAVSAMTQILTDADKTVCELAAAVGESYHFLNER